MIKRLLKRILRRFGLLPGPNTTSWEQYREYVRIHPTAIIAPSAHITIFNPPVPPRICLEVGEGSHIFSTFALLRPEATIRIGKRTQLGNSNFVCADSIEVGDDVLMAWGVTVMDNDSHALAWEQRANDVVQCCEDYRTDPGNFIRNKNWDNVGMGPICIGNKSWVGFNVSILKGVTVGEGAIVGAASLVVKDVPPFTVVAGNPARVVKKLEESGLDG
jgi:galactoside O-acetyltransferase